MQDDIAMAMRWLMLLALLRLCYGLGQGRPIETKALPQLVAPGPDAGAGLASPRWKERAAKAARSYAEAQERMWRNWEKAMFHRR